MNRTRRLAYEGALFSIAVVLVLAWAVRLAQSWDSLRASIIILFLGSIGVVLALIQAVLDIRSLARAAPSRREGISFDAPAVESANRWGGLEIWGWLVGFYIGIRLIGFIVAVPLFVFAYSKIYGARWYVCTILAAASWAFIYGTFEQILHVPWPEPILTAIYFGQ